MNNAFHFASGNKYIKVSAANSVEDGHVWIVETNMDFKELPVSFRSRAKDTDDQAVEKLIMSVSQWAKSNGFTQTMNTYLCRINVDRVETFKAQWHYPEHIETWSMEVSAPDEQSARNIAFNALKPIGGRRNVLGTTTVVELTPEWIYTELVSSIPKVGSGVTAP